MARTCIETKTKIQSANNRDLKNRISYDKIKMLAKDKESPNLEKNLNIKFCKLNTSQA